MVSILAAGRRDSMPPQRKTPTDLDERRVESHLEPSPLKWLRVCKRSGSSRTEPNPLILEIFRCGVPLVPCPPASPEVVDHNGKTRPRQTSPLTTHNVLGTLDKLDLVGETRCRVATSQPRPNAGDERSGVKRILGVRARRRGYTHQPRVHIPNGAALGRTHDEKR